jgi:hypothetical protein
LIVEARKTGNEFNLSSAPHIAVSKLKELAEGSYIDCAESVLFIGDSGAGRNRSHLKPIMESPPTRRGFGFSWARGGAIAPAHPDPPALFTGGGSLQIAPDTIWSWVGAQY